jgi:hypothetical protein
LNSPSATALTLQSAGTTAITVDTSQNVGINQTSPTVISTAKQLAIKAPTNGDALFVSQNSNGLTTFIAGYYGVTAGPDKPVVGSYSNDPLAFITNNTERMRINAGAPILCLAGGSTTATGTGIAFPATQSASSDANTLDDYEEGTWTPTWNGSGSNPTQSGNASCGYVKIGKLVTVFGDFYCTSVSGGSGALSIGNLPFTSSSGTSGYSGVPLGLSITWNATGAPTRGYIGASTNAIQLYTNSSSDSRSNTAIQCTVTNTSLTSFSEIYFSFSYLASA